MSDALINEAITTVVDQWIVTGEPGPMPGLPGHRFPAYRMVWSSADQRWPGEHAETEARKFVAGVLAVDYAQWEDGPHLHHRTVTYSPLETVP